MLCTIKISYNLIIPNITHNIKVHCISREVGQLMADSKSCTKKCSESENNVVGSMIFCGPAGMSAGILIGA